MQKLRAGELTFRELVQRVHETVASALAHADVAQMQVIAELARRQHLLAFNAIPYQVWSPTSCWTSYLTPPSRLLAPCIQVVTSSSSSAYGWSGKEAAGKGETGCAEFGGKGTGKGGQPQVRSSGLQRL